MSTYAVVIKDQYDMKERTLSTQPRTRVEAIEELAEYHFYTYECAKIVRVENRETMLTLIPKDGLARALDDTFIRMTSGLLGGDPEFVDGFKACLDAKQTLERIWEKAGI